jgi:NAD(P)-dependent dehydrogenase (short-subunit alcohol dehydrogenase family)
VIIHNAADFDISRKHPVNSTDGVESVWATNHVGPVLLNQQLQPELLRSRQGRVITVSSQGLVGILNEISF